MKRMRGRKGKGRGKSRKPVMTTMENPFGGGGRKKGRGGKSR